MNWDTKWTEAFVLECVEQKKILQKDNIPLNVWKVISEALEKNHKITVAWNYCRDRFAQMKAFFLASLPVEGIIHGSKWPFYDNFCHLFEIPIEYHSLILLGENDGDDDDEEERDEADPGKGKYNLSYFIILTYMILF